MSNSTQHKKYLDGWRGFAILCVFYSHFLSLGNTRWLGSFGVDLFFVLSGFLMAEILFIRKQNLKIFFIRRISRIVPVFVIYVCAAFIISEAIIAHKYRLPTDELLSTLIFLRSYYPANPSIWEATWSIGHIWSLNIEEHTYIFLAAVAFCTKNKNKDIILIVLASAIILTFIFRYLHAFDIVLARSDFTLYSHVAAYSILVPVTFRLLLDWKYVFLLTDRIKSSVSIICILSAIIVSSPMVGKPILAPFFLAVSICYFDHNPTTFKRIFSIKIFRIFGKAAFSLYLWQQIFYENIDNKFYGLCFALAIGFLSYAMIENPLRKLINSKYATSPHV